MITPERVALAWSGGKDSSMTLTRLRADLHCEVAVLLTTVTEDYNRISLHGVRRELLEDQAWAVGVPLTVAYIPADATDEIYRARMEQTFRTLLADGITTVAFGDLFLEHVRRYREGWLPTIGVKPIFPLWHEDTRRLAEAFVQEGFAAIVACVDTTWLDPEFVGRQFDAGFLHDLPAHVDPCGERGEFHTFVYDGPIFHHRVPVHTGERVQRGVRVFCDLTLAPASSRTEE
jgi:uncharacterized protein (TIGR00290 family)